MLPSKPRRGHRSVFPHNSPGATALGHWRQESGFPLSSLPNSVSLSAVNSQTSPAVNKWVSPTVGAQVCWPHRLGRPNGTIHGRLQFRGGYLEFRRVGEK